MFPFVEGVELAVRIEDASGRSYEQTIDNRDLWRDVDEQYDVVECHNDRVMVGQVGLFSPPRYFELSKAEFEQIAKPR